MCEHKQTCLHRRDVPITRSPLGTVCTFPIPTSLNRFLAADYLPARNRLPLPSYLREGRGFFCLFTSLGCLLPLAGRIRGARRAQRNMIGFNSHYNKLTLIVCLAVLPLAACSASAPECEMAKPQKIVLQAIRNPKVATPEYLAIFKAEDIPEKPFAEISPVHARAWSYRDGVNNLREKAFLLGADAIINVRYKTQQNFEYFKDIYFLCGDAVVWQELHRGGDAVAVH